MKRESFFSAKIFSTVALLLLIIPPTFANSAELLKLTVIHMNDPHAHYLPYEEKRFASPIGGFARAKTVITEILNKNQLEGRHTLILMGGDLLTGTPFSTAFKGRLGVQLMNKIKFDAMTVGNHEFDYGLGNLLNNMKPLMQFALLSANTRTLEGKTIFESKIEKTYPESTKVIVFGLTTTETPITTHPKNVKGLVFDDPIQTAKAILKEVGNKDFVIALTHLGLESDKALARSCPRINLIVGGHSHTALLEPLKVNDTIIVQAGAYSKYVGKLDLNIKDGKIVSYDGKLILLDERIEESVEIASTIADYKKRLDVALEKVIGRTEVYLEGGMQAVRSGQNTNLGRLITYIITKDSRADAGLINGGSIRASIKEGNITLSDLYTVLPFSGTVVTMELTGNDLQAVLQRSANLEIGSGGKLQTFGIDFTSHDGKINIVKIGGLQFEANKRYKIATNDFLSAGGDGYSILKEKGENYYNSGAVIADLLADFIAEKGVITEQILNEIR